ncbi:MAG: hypothetical protein P1V20_00335 [Verrucomicrobiales bacterium]|nr:hypothetical protein [Verrucomicrobiales bacterium]
MIRYVLPVLAFTLVAVVSFSVWAFGGRVLNSTWSLYTSCAVVFLLLGGVALLPFSGGAGRKPLYRLLWLFPLSFTVYSICWTVGWLSFKNHFGEIVGSATGIIAMTAVIRTKLPYSRTVLEASAVVFLFYTVGYYAGEMIYKEVGGLWGKLGWGTGFGAGLGAGLAYLVQLSASSRN